MSRRSALATVGALAGLATAVSCSAADQTVCPLRPSTAFVTVDVSAVAAPATLKLCTSYCTTRPSRPRHPLPAITVGYEYTGTATEAPITVSLTVRQAARSRTDSIVLRIPQDGPASKECGSYGGPGYAIADSHGRLHPSVTPILSP